MQESERELQALQQQLEASEARSNGLAAGLMEAEETGAQQRLLVSQLSSVVSTQKDQLGGLAREREELRRSLARCSPGEFDRLSADLLAAR